MTTASARLLVGRSIVAFDPGAFDDPNGVCHRPVITLDNGARITFTVEETDSGDTYGVLPVYRPVCK